MSEPERLMKSRAHSGTILFVTKTLREGGIHDDCRL